MITIVPCPSALQWMYLGEGAVFFVAGILVGFVFLLCFKELGRGK